MLIKCPECELQISDKALSCPHCGYPMVKQDKPFTPSRSTKHRRLPNGFGQITEIKNKNLRNRFRVMVTTSRTPEGRPICKLLKPKAYFETYNEAYSALMEYNKNPYDLDMIITMKELYDRWSKENYKKMSPTNVRNHRAAWAYCTPLYEMKLVDVRSRHLKQCIEEANIIRNNEKVEASAQSKSRIKILFNALFDFAMEYDLVEKNYARAFDLPESIQQEINRNHNDHIAFDDFELKKMWNNLEKFDYIGYILFQCYSGLRPTELCLITLDNVHLDENYIVAGIKTEAGRDRIIPIHPKVKSIVEKEYKRAKEMRSPWLFNYLETRNRTGNPKLTYDRYRVIFVGILQELNLSTEHKPHDPRKTFITLAKKYKMDEYALKRIVGHYIDDITEAVYTERSLDWYIEEMQKIK